MTNEGPLPLSKKEMELVEQVAAQEGKTVEQVASELVQAGLARRVKKRTGRGPAKVYQIKGRK